MQSGYPYGHQNPFKEIRKIGERGFGFIAVKGEGDVFFHVSDCVSSFDDLGEGDAVEFELTDSKGRQRTMKVKRIE